DDLAVHQADLDAADGAAPGNVGHGDGQRRTVHAGDLGRVVGVHAHDGHGDADVIAHIRGEQRGDGTVDHAGVQDRMLTGAAHTAHEAAGNAACGLELFLKLNAEREKVNAVTGLYEHGDIAQHAGLAVA